MSDFSGVVEVIPIVKNHQHEKSSNSGKTVELPKIKSRSRDDVANNTLSFVHRYYRNPEIRVSNKYQRIAIAL